MNLLSNKIFLYSVGGVLVIIIGVLTYFAFFRGDSSTLISESGLEESNSDIIVSQIIENNKLVANSDLYSDQDHGVLSYVASNRSFNLLMPKTVTTPEYNREKKLQLEQYVVDRLGITIDQLCVIPFTETSSTGESLIIDLCLGEE